MFVSISAMVILFTLFVLGWFSVSAASADTGINKQLNYQAKLRTAAGAQVTDQNWNFRFRVYDAAAAGNLLWTERWTSTSTPVATVNGVFSVALGSIYSLSNIGAAYWNTDSLYLQVDLDADGNGSWEESFGTRKRLTAAAYAFNADVVDGFNATSTAAVANYLMALDVNKVLNLFDGSVSSTRATSTYLTVGHVGAETIFADGVAGQVNIGTTTLATDKMAKLAIAKEGVSNIINGLFVDQNFFSSGVNSTSSAAFFRSYEPGLNQLDLIFGNKVSVGGDARYSFMEAWGTAGTNLFMLNEDGQLGLGTSTPWAGYKLAVSGNSMLAGNLKVSGSATTTNTLQVIGGLATGGAIPNTTTTANFGGNVLIQGNATTTGSTYLGDNTSGIWFTEYTISGGGYDGTKTRMLQGNSYYDIGGGIIIAQDNFGIGVSNGFKIFESFVNPAVVLPLVASWESLNSPNITFASADLSYDASIKFHTTTDEMHFDSATLYDFDNDLEITGELAVNQAPQGSYDVDINGNLHTSDVIYSGTWVHVGYDADNDDDYLLFDQGNESLMWDNANDLFVASNDLSVTGYASSTLGFYTQGNGHFGGNSTTTGSFSAGGMLYVRDNKLGIATTTWGMDSSIFDTVSIQGNTGFYSGADINPQILTLGRTRRELLLVNIHQAGQWADGSEVGDSVIRTNNTESLFLQSGSNSNLVLKGQYTGINTTTPGGWEEGHLTVASDHQVMATFDSTYNGPAYFNLYNLKAAGNMILSVGKSNGYGGGLTYDNATNIFTLDSFSNAAGLSIKTEASAPIIFSITNQEKMRLTTDGNLGIHRVYATSTLDVDGTLAVSGNATTTGRLVLGADPVTDYGSKLYVTGDSYFEGNASTTGSFYVGGTLGVGTTSPFAGTALAVSGTLYGDITASQMNITDVDFVRTKIVLGSSFFGSPYIEGIDQGGGNYHLNFANATHYIFSDSGAGVRIPMLNATTTNAGSLLVFNNATTSGHSYLGTTAGLNNVYINNWSDISALSWGWATTSEQYFWNNTSTWSGSQSEFNKYFNATTTWNAYDTNWDRVFNATSTWWAFGSNWNDWYNATTTKGSNFTIDGNATTTGHLTANDILYIKDNKIGVGTSSPKYTFNIEGNNTTTLNVFSSSTEQYSSALNVRQRGGTLISSAIYGEATGGQNLINIGIGGFAANGLSTNTGVYGNANGASTAANYGLRSYASNSLDKNYGGYFYSNGEDAAVNYGLYAEAALGAANYAGYFNGNLMVVGKTTSTLALYVGTSPSIENIDETGGDLYVKDDVEIDGEIFAGLARFSLLNATSTYFDNTTSTNSLYVGAQLSVATTSPWAGYELAIAGDAVLTGDLLVSGSATTTGSFSAGGMLYVRDNKLGIATTTWGMDSSIFDTVSIQGNTGFYSGADFNPQILTLGRTKRELLLVNIHLANQWANGSEAGDSVIRTNDTESLFLQSGANSNLTLKGTFTGVNTTTPGGTYGEKLTVSGNAFFDGSATSTNFYAVSGLGLNSEYINQWSDLNAYFAADNPFNQWLDSTSSPQFNSVTTTGNLYVGGFASTTGSSYVTGSGHFGGSLSVDGNATTTGTTYLGNATSGIRFEERTISGGTYDGSKIKMMQGNTFYNLGGGIVTVQGDLGIGVSRGFQIFESNLDPAVFLPLNVSWETINSPNLSFFSTALDVDASIAFHTTTDELHFDGANIYNFDNDVTITGELAVNQAPQGSYDVDINGSLHSTGVVYAGSSIQVGYDAGNDDDYAYFDAGGQYLVWSDGNDEFQLSNDLNVTGSVTSTDRIYAASQISVATSSPWAGYELAVTGDAVLTGDLLVSGSATSTNFYASSGLGLNGEYINQWSDLSAYVSGGSAAWQATSTDFTGIYTLAGSWLTPTTSAVNVYLASNFAVDGNIGIGTTTPASALTVVGGNIMHTASGTPTLLKTVDTGMTYNSFDISGKYLFATYQTSGVVDYFKIYDISDPTSPVAVFTSLDLLAEATDIKVVGNYAYITCSNSGLRIYDISNPANSFQTDALATTPVGSAKALKISGKYAYIAAGAQGLMVFDISNPYDIRQAGLLDTDGTANSIYISGKYAYLTDSAGSSSAGEFDIIDISNPTSPVSVSNFDITGAGDNGSIALNTMFISGKYAYLGGSPSGLGDGGLVILDISNPAAPVIAKSIFNTSQINGIRSLYLAGDYLYLGRDGSAATTLKFDVYDVASSTQAYKVSSLDMGDNDKDANNIAIYGKYAFVAAQTNGIHILDLNGMKTPLLTVGIINAGSISVAESLGVGQQLTVGTGVNIGYNGIMSLGSLNILSTSTSLIAGNLGIASTTPWAGYEMAVGGDAAIGGDLLISAGSISQTPALPKHVSSVLDDSTTYFLNTASDVFIAGKYAYVTSYGDDNLQIYDITDPYFPKLISTFTDPGAGAVQMDGARSVFVSGKYAYVTGEIDDGFEIVDISNPYAPFHAGGRDDTACDTDAGGNYCMLDGAYDIYVSGKYAYITANVDDGVSVFDISSTTNVTNISYIKDSDNAATYELNGATKIAVAGRYAYITGNDDDGVEIIDISNHATTTHVGSITDAGSTELLGAFDIAVSGKYAYVTGYDDDGVEILDISNPAAPSHVAFISTSTYLDGARDLILSGNYLWIASQVDDRLTIVDIASSTNPSVLNSFVDTAESALDGPKSIAVAGRYAYIACDGGGTDGLEVMDISGIEATAANIGNIETNILQVSENAFVGNELFVKNGLNVGLNGINTNGALNVISASSTASFINYQLGVNTTTPWSGYELAVAGDGVFTGNLLVSGNATSTSFYASSGLGLNGEYIDQWSDLSAFITSGNPFNQWLDSTSSPQFNSVTTTGNLYVGGFASTTGSSYVTGSGHFGGNLTVDGNASSTGGFFTSGILHVGTTTATSTLVPPKSTPIAQGTSPMSASLERAAGTHLLHDQGSNPEKALTNCMRK